MNMTDQDSFKTWNDKPKEELIYEIGKLKTENQMLRGQIDRLTNERNTFLKKISDLQLPDSNMRGQAPKSVQQQSPSPQQQPQRQNISAPLPRPMQ
jgi:hypothetical protein